MTKDEFIEKAKIVEDKKYDYSLVEYKGNKVKVRIICPIHGEFLVRPNDFLSGHMCKKCGIERRSKMRLMRQDVFIEKTKSLFPQYDYSLVNYLGAHKDVRLICPIHGEFKAKPCHLLNGHGCKKCGQILTHKKQMKSKEKFVEEARKIHGDKYDYSKVNYEGRDKDVCIICKKHGEFLQSPSSHLQGNGCKICSESKLEKEIEAFLIENKINYIHEKRFKWLGKQHLDFYLPNYNVAIECQGIQHFKSVEYFGGDKSFAERVERETIERKKYVKKITFKYYITHHLIMTVYTQIKNYY